MTWLSASSRRSPRHPSLSLWTALSLLLLPLGARAADEPVPEQGAGEHSSVNTSDGSIRDDELAKHICDSIPKKDGVPQVKDVKIMVASCYGGGILDDIQQVFGPGGDCEGVSWVGGSASTATQPAKGWKDSVVDSKKHKAKNLGSNWTDALAGKETSTTDSNPGSIRDGASDNVLGDLKGAAKNDDSGPNHDALEDPVSGSGNGGDSIEWNEAGTKHEAVVFGGNQTNSRHHNNVENVGEALDGIWADKDSNIQTLDGGTTKDLKDAITKAGENLDPDTQLVIYLDDHGDTHFDIGEWFDAVFPPFFEPIPDNGAWLAQFQLHPGWEEGLLAMEVQLGDEPAPALIIDFAQPIDAGHWTLALNGVPIPLPAGILAGPYQLPVDWTSIQTGTNSFEIAPVGSPIGDTMLLAKLELISGPINEVEKGPLCQPGGPQSKGQQKCILELDKNLRLMAKTQASEISRCIKDYSKGKLSLTTSLEECLTADAKGKVAKKSAKTIEKDGKKCGEAPDFGATSGELVNEQAIKKEIDLVHDIFGSDLSTSIVVSNEDKTVSKCQQDVLKFVFKCQDAKLKEFEKCKKPGLRDGSIGDSCALAACLGDDPKGKIQKACSAKLADRVSKSCLDRGIGNEAFPGCGPSENLALCLDRHVECRVCLALRRVDALDNDCDLLDDGAMNGSCPNR